MWLSSCICKDRETDVGTVTDLFVGYVAALAQPDAQNWYKVYQISYRVIEEDILQKKNRILTELPDHTCIDTETPEISCHYAAFLPVYIGQYSDRPQLPGSPTYSGNGLSARIKFLQQTLGWRWNDYFNIDNSIPMYIMYVYTIWIHINMYIFIFVYIMDCYCSIVIFLLYE